MTTERKINRIPKSELPELPDGWGWSDAATALPSGKLAPCWDAEADSGALVWVHTADSIDSTSDAGDAGAVLDLVKYANGLGPDPRPKTPPTRDNRALAIALLAAVMDDNEDPRIEAAIALLENA